LRWGNNLLDQRPVKIASSRGWLAKGGHVSSVDGQTRVDRIPYLPVPVASPVRATMRRQKRGEIRERIMTTIRLLCLTAAAAFVAGGTAFASPSSPSPAAGKLQAQTAASGSFNHTLGASAFASGSGGTALNPGFNTINQRTVRCPVSSCTFTVESMIQVATPDGFWAVCPTVDGAFTNPPCPYQGSVPSGGSAYVTGNSRASITVGMGAHTVATTVYVDSASTLANWESDFALYTP
jgi:hypothetical protein